MELKIHTELDFLVQEQARIINEYDMTVASFGGREAELNLFLLQNPARWQEYLDRGNSLNAEKCAALEPYSLAMKALQAKFFAEVYTPAPANQGAFMAQLQSYFEAIIKGFEISISTYENVLKDLRQPVTI